MELKDVIKLNTTDKLIDLWFVKVDGKYLVSKSNRVCWRQASGAIQALNSSHICKWAKTYWKPEIKDREEAWQDFLKSMDNRILLECQHCRRNCPGIIKESYYNIVLGK